MAGIRPSAATCSSPKTGEVQRRWRSLRGGSARSRRERQSGAAGLGGDQSAAPRPRDDAVPRSGRAANESSPSCSAREHGKTIPDAKGDIQRGLEVAEFACGVPHLMKGEYTDGAGPGIDMYSMRQPLGVVAGITPFNFPAMIPMWKAAPAIACGNAFILKPSERDPSCRCGSPNCSSRRGCRRASSMSSTATRRRSMRILDDPDIGAVGFVGSTPIAEYVYRARRRAWKARACFGGAKNHMIVMPDADMDQAVDALIGAGYGSAGERCMAISVAVPVARRPRIC